MFQNQEPHKVFCQTTLTVNTFSSAGLLNIFIPHWYFVGRLGNKGKDGLKRTPEADLEHTALLGDGKSNERSWMQIISSNNVSSPIYTCVWCLLSPREHKNRYGHESHNNSILPIPETPTHWQPHTFESLYRLVNLKVLKAHNLEQWKKVLSWLTLSFQWLTYTQNKNREAPRAVWDYVRAVLCVHTEQAVDTVAESFLLNPLL